MLWDNIIFNSSITTYRIYKRATFVYGYTFEYFVQHIIGLPSANLHDFIPLKMLIKILLFTNDNTIKYSIIHHKNNTI